jgi:hypothetical protein
MKKTLQNTCIEKENELKRLENERTLITNNINNTIETMTNDITNMEQRQILYKSILNTNTSLKRKHTDTEDNGTFNIHIHIQQSNIKHTHKKVSTVSSLEKQDHKTEETSTPSGSKRFTPTMRENIIKCTTSLNYQQNPQTQHK